MVFRSQFLYPCLVASAAVLLLICLNWQCLLLVFLMGGISWGLWTIAGNAGTVRGSDITSWLQQEHKHAGGRIARPRQSQSSDDTSLPTSASRLYRFPHRSRFAAK